ncbi:MAG: hypothetical protein NTW62_01945 [Candidatus Nomurabacteria bacterium]|nr:hypothetical protein [Candidatus Nomurabacteria bacterium]
MNQFNVFKLPFTFGFNVTFVSDFNGMMGQLHPNFAATPSMSGTILPL